MILECQGISKSFGGVQALTDVSVRFPSNGSVAIVGPNGAGKTTLIDSLTGLIRPDKGAWILDGRDVTGFSIDNMVRLGVARSFQGIRLLADQTVLDNIALAIPDQNAETLRSALFSLRANAHSDVVLKRAHTLANSVGLMDRLFDPVHSLSYGEQKLVSALATAATGATILMLDEPMAGVQGDGIEKIAILTKNLVNSGHLIIFVEHDMAAVRRLADIVVVLAQGQVLTVGPPDEVLERNDLLEAYLA